MEKPAVLALLFVAIPAMAAIPSGYVSYWKLDGDLSDENGALVDTASSAGMAASTATASGWAGTATWPSTARNVIPRP